MDQLLYGRTVELQFTPLSRLSQVRRSCPTLPCGQSFSVAVRTQRPALFEGRSSIELGYRRNDLLGH